MKRVISLTLAVFLAGCTSHPTKQELESADYGTYPSNYIQIAKNYFDTILKDPDSAKYRDISAPRALYLGSRISGINYGYLVCVPVNAKNSFGAYVGYKTNGLLIRNGAVIQYVPDGVWFGRQMC